MTWRERAAPIIAETIRRVGRENPTELRKALRDAYPFGPRKYHPYKAWLAEVRAQLGYGLQQPQRDSSQRDLLEGVD